MKEKIANEENYIQNKKLMLNKANEAKLEHFK